MTRKRESVTLGEKIMYAFLLSLGLVFLLWGGWIHFSGLGTRPAGLEYLMMIVGAVFVIGGIIVVLARVLMFSSKEEP